MSDWQQINNLHAEHGDRFLAYDPDVGTYVCDKYVDYYVLAWNQTRVFPTHWMPLPEPPEKSG